MTKDELQQIAESTLERAWEIRQTRDDVVPMWFLIDENDKTELIASPWEDDVQKHGTMHVIADRIKEQKIQAVISLTDVYVRVERDLDSVDYTPPSQTPDRSTEALMVQCASRSGDRFALCRQYGRNDDGSFYIKDDQVLPELAESGTFAPVWEAISVQA